MADWRSSATFTGQVDPTSPGPCSTGQAPTPVSCLTGHPEAPFGASTLAVFIGGVHCGKF